MRKSELGLTHYLYMVLLCSVLRKSEYPAYVLLFAQAGFRLARFFMGGGYGWML